MIYVWLLDILFVTVFAVVMLQYLALFQDEITIQQEETEK